MCGLSSYIITYIPIQSYTYKCNKNKKNQFYYITAKDYTSKEDRNVCICCIDFGHHPIKSQLDCTEANAKLIAAAPVLLKEHIMDLEHLKTWKKQLIQAGLRGSTMYQEYKDMIDKIGTSPRDGGLISSSMSKIGPVLGVDMSGYHDALTDCIITMEMFKKIIELLKEYSHIDIMKYQVERIKILR